jgi:ribonuclease HII
MPKELEYRANKPKIQVEKPKHIKKAEWLRLLELHIFEREARQKGFGLIAGVDEAGRGPLAGPVVAAACTIPEGTYFPGIDDSKKLTPKQRKILFEKITSDSNVQFGVGIVSHIEIDRINILQATIQAMLEALAKLCKQPQYILVDGLELKHGAVPCQKIVGGDGLSHSIAAASIIAKETRDRLMEEEHKKWPEYGFSSHKGYGTEKHLEALAKYGPCPIHRMTFAPLAGLNAKRDNPS